MIQEITKTESVFKYEDETIRKAAILSKITELIEKDILSSVRMEAVACLQKQ